MTRIDANVNRKRAERVALRTRIDETIDELDLILESCEEQLARRRSGRTSPGRQPRRARS